jgi:hypothetical protein
MISDRKNDKNRPRNKEEDLGEYRLALIFSLRLLSAGNVVAYVTEALHQQPQGMDASIGPSKTGQHPQWYCQ